MEITPEVLGELLNNNQVELSENNLILLFCEFLKYVYRAMNIAFVLTLECNYKKMIQ